MGAELVAISPQIKAKNVEVKQRHRLAFSVLSDRGNAYARKLSIAFSLAHDLKEVYRGFGIMLPEYNEDDSWELPIPTRLIVDEHGVIHNVEADPDYTRRPEPESALEVLSAISRTS